MSVAFPFARTVTAADGATTITSGLVWAGNFTSEAFVFNPALSINANIATITLAGGWQQFGIDRQVAGDCGLSAITGCLNKADLVWNIDGANQVGDQHHAAV